MNRIEVIFNRDLLWTLPYNLPSILQPSFINMIILTSKCGVFLQCALSRHRKQGDMDGICEIRGCPSTEYSLPSFFVYSLISSRRIFLQYYTTYYSFPIHVSPFITKTYKVLHNFCSWYISQSTELISVVCYIYIDRCRC